MSFDSPKIEVKNERSESPSKHLIRKWLDSGELIPGCSIVKWFKDVDGNSKKWWFEEESASSSNESLGYEVEYEEKKVKPPEEKPKLIPVAVIPLKQP